jgi:ankyrin repeat protein
MNFLSKLYKRSQNISQEKLNQDLIHAAEGCNLKQARKLLRAGADPNCKGPHSRTSLAFAVRRRHKDLVLILLAKGADPNCEAAYLGDPGYSVLMQAALWGDLSAVKALLKSGAEANHQSQEGLTPLINAIRGVGERVYERQEVDLVIIKVLLAAGADPDCQDIDGLTALMYAAGWGCLDAVKIHLAYRARLDIKDHIGMTAYHHAIRNGHQEVADLLVSHGADPSPCTPVRSSQADATDQPVQI